MTLSAPPRRGLLLKAAGLFLVIAALGTLEVGFALAFKNELKKDFNRVAEFDTRERDYLYALLVSAELGYELSVPTQGVVFLRVSHWLRRLKDLSEVEKRIPRVASDGSADPVFANALVEMRALLDRSAGNQELAVFAQNVRRLANEYSQQLHSGVTDVRQQRAEQVRRYGQKADYYAAILLAIGVAGFAVVVLISGLFLVRLVRSLVLLERRAKQITNGNYGKPLESDRTDEVGQLVQSVNRMAYSLETREKEVEDFRRRLFQQEKSFTIGSFAAGIAHEVGNPIQAIMALTAQAAESLMEDTSEANVEENVDRLELIAQQCERLSRVVNEIREFTHTGMPDKDLVNVNEVISTTLRLMRFDRRFKHVRVRTDLSPDLPAVQAVADHLVQIFINLLINAADAMEDRDGDVLVETRANPNRVTITVSDQGSGMTPEALARATEPFFTTKAKGKGTGLGLAVCRQIVEEHDGTLDIQSVVDMGTTITISLPATAVPKRGEPAEPTMETLED